MRRSLTVLALAALAVALGVISVGSASADVTGATATKNCAQGPFNIGQTIPCTFTVVNAGAFPATIVSLTEQSPFPGGASTPITCVGSDTVTYQTGDTLPPGVTCSGAFTVQVPNDPSLCGNFLRDQVGIDLSYPQFNPPLEAGAFATATTAIVCPAKVLVTKTATPLSKPTDPVTYTVTVTNNNIVSESRVSVLDTLDGDISANFPATLTPGQSASFTYTRTVLASDPNPLLNTVTAIYGDEGTTASASATASTDLFYPHVAVTKSCSPKPVEVGNSITCTITVTNTSTGTTPPALDVNTIVDTISGNLLDSSNAHVTNSTCGASLATGGSCVITTTESTSEASLPGPVVNSVVVHYHPDGFPNDITANATDTVPIHTSPAMTLVKSCSPQSVHVGDTVQYTFVVTNTGDITLNRVSANDSLMGDLTADFPASLAPGASVTLTLPRVVLQSDPSTLTNVITTVYGNSVVSITLTKTSQCSVTVVPPVGTTKLTIGFWKTHAPASCKQGNGKQADALTPALGSGFPLGSHYTLTSACAAVALLSKNVLGSGDPIGNMLAQMVGAELNIGAGGTTGGSCSFITQAITDANTLLSAINFNGTSYTKPLTTAQKNQANTLEGLFGSYNNDSATC